jgi:hypothetical protein
MDTTRLCARQGVSGMKKSKAVVAMVAIALIIAIGAMAGRTANASGPSDVALGGAGSFAVLAGAGITNTGPTTITGDAGTFSTTTETGFGSVTINGTNHGGDGFTQVAKTDLLTAYNQAAGSGPTIPVPGDLVGLTLVPGVYNSASSLLLTGALTLSGGPSDVWIFQAGSSLTTLSGSSVVLIGGAQSCHVYWQVGSSAVIGTGSTFKGTILAKASITVTTGATIDGRALADAGGTAAGAVTLDTNTITRSTCATTTAPAGGGGGGTSERERPEATAAPTATPIPAPVFPPGQTVAPTTAPIATAALTVAPAAVPTATSTPASAVAGVETRPLTGVHSLPSTSTDGPWSPLMGFGIALAGIGILLLFGKPVRHP